MNVPEITKWRTRPCLQAWKSFCSPLPPLTRSIDSSKWTRGEATLIETDGNFLHVKPYLAKNRGRQSERIQVRKKGGSLQHPTRTTLVHARNPTSALRKVSPRRTLRLLAEQSTQKIIQNTPICLQEHS